jgi:hypothetical protein
VPSNGKAAQHRVASSLEDLMSALTRVITFATVATSVVLVSSTASADAKSDCSEARSFLRSDAARRTCSARYHTARSLFCSSPTGQRLLLNMARSCKARASASPGSSTKAPETSASTAPGGTKVEDIPTCRAYFAHILACPPAKPVSREEEMNLFKKGYQEKLNKGTRVDIISGACQIADKVHKC